MNASTAAARNVPTLDLIRDFARQCRARAAEMDIEITNADIADRIMRHEPTARELGASLVLSAIATS